MFSHTENSLSGENDDETFRPGARTTATGNDIRGELEIIRVMYKFLTGLCLRQFVNRSVELQN